MGPERWLACCPALNDKSPSLAIRRFLMVPLLVHCFMVISAHEIVSGWP